MIQTRISHSIGNYNNKCTKRGIMALNERAKYSFVCRKCKYELCQNCCHKMAIEKYIQTNYKNELIDDSKDNAQFKSNNPTTNQKQKQKQTAKKNNISWRFDFFYDHNNKGSQFHAIENNGTKVKCNANSVCHCF